MTGQREKQIFDKQGKAGITLAEVLRFDKSTRLKNLEIGESSGKMATQNQQPSELEDYFQTDNMMKSIKEMNNRKKKCITSMIAYNSANKYIPRANGAESIFEVLETYFEYVRLKHQLYLVMTLNGIDDGMDNIMVYHQQLEKQDKARKGDDSVSAKSLAYSDTIPHEIFMSEIKDGEQKQLIEEMLKNISNLTYLPRGDCTCSEYYFKQFNNVLREKDMNKAYAEWVEIARTLEEKMMWTYFRLHWTCRLAAIPKGAENYFRQFDTLLEATLSACGSAVPPEFSMQKATCAIMIADLQWNVTNKANLDLWKIIEEIDVEDNTKDLPDEVVRDKTGDENKDENNPVFNADGKDSYNDYNDKDNDKNNDGREGIKAPQG
eukprot:jgi/Psemu1/25982/gm1.25982_g